MLYFPLAKPEDVQVVFRPSIDGTSRENLSIRLHQAIAVDEDFLKTETLTKASIESRSSHYIFKRISELYGIKNAVSRATFR